MKRLSILVVILLLFCCKDDLKYRRYFLGDERTLVTRADLNKNGQKTYLYRGGFLFDDLPKSYLIVDSKPMLGGFQALIKSDSGRVILYQPYYYFRKVGNEKSLIIINMDEQKFYKLFFDKKQNEYIRVQNE